jgi:hypothetical protein
MQNVARPGHVRLGAVVLGCFALTLLAERAAQACSYEAQPPALQGYPDEGALDVPTDVRLIYAVSSVAHTELLASVDPQRVANEDDPEPELSPLELIDEAGAVTPLELTDGGGSWLFESVPRAALLPRTRYVLRTTEPLSADGELRLSFTTGDGPLTTLPEPPSVEIEHYLLELPDRCGPSAHGTCLAFAEPAAGFYIAARPFQQAEPHFRDVYLARKPWFFDIAGIDQHGHDCIEFRTRAPNGALSDPINRCRGDGPLYEIAGSSAVACTAAGITARGQLVSSPPEDVTSEASSQPSSCAMAPLPYARAFGLSVLPLLAMLLRRRDRRASVEKHHRLSAARSR